MSEVETIATGWDLYKYIQQHGRAPGNFPVEIGSEIDQVFPLSEDGKRRILFKTHEHYIGFNVHTGEVTSEAKG